MATPVSDMPSIDSEHCDADAATGHWDGQRLQRDYAIAVLADLRYRNTG
jgi:hypothetical protein